MSSGCKLAELCRLQLSINEKRHYANEVPVRILLPNTPKSLVCSSYCSRH